MISWTILYVYILFFVTAGTWLLQTNTADIYRKATLFMLVAGLVVFSGFRNQIGNDYDSYKKLYDEIGTDTFSTYVEPGFAVIIQLLNQVGAGYQVMFLLFAALTMLLVALTVSKYAANPYLAMALFLLLPNYFFNSMSIMRQFFAIGMVFYSVTYIIKRKFIPFLAMILFASLFHKTAFIILPFYFLGNVNFHWSILVGLLVLSILFPIADHLPLFVINILFGDYEMYLGSKPPEFGIGITLIVRVILFLAVLLIRGRQRGKAGQIISNLYLLGVIVYFTTLGSEALSRISLYLMVFEIIALVNAIYLFRKKDAIILSAAYALYCTMLYYTNLVGYSKYYVPNTSEGNIHYSFNFELKQ